VKFLIIGSGPTGLGAAYRLKELGEKDFMILERGQDYGGLASSFVDEKGFTWDIGVHAQFSHYKYFNDLMTRSLKLGWLDHVREVWAWLYNSWVPYPVQNNIRHFPPTIMKKCLDGIVAAHAAAPSKPRNFREWILKIFGVGLAEAFMFPYNLKVWAYPPEAMSYQWIGERVAVTDPAQVKKNIDEGIDEVSWGPNSKFRYPAVGGTGTVWRAVADLVGLEKIKLGAEVVSIDTSLKTVRVSSGEVFKYENLLSTMPIDLLCSKITPSLGADVLSAAKKLKHSTSHIVGLGLKGQVPEFLKTKSWAYFSEDNCPFYRVTIFSNFSPKNVPDSSKYWSLICETSESTVKPVNRKTIVEDTIKGAVTTGLISGADQVVSKWFYTAEYGYPTPSLERDEALAVLFPALEARGVYSRGRFGAWRYEVSNQDHSLMQGVEWVNFIVRGEAEKVLVSQS
jgi:protoporphyrinogen oxidase